ncbi:MAG: flagellar hook-length control protein FliK [Magnetococcus sp. WYHC-3]
MAGAAAGGDSAGAAAGIPGGEASPPASSGTTAEAAATTLATLSGGASGEGSSSAPAKVLGAHHPRFAEALAEESTRLRRIARPGQPEQMRIRLEPRELGTLLMDLTVDGAGKVHLNITTESEAAREVITRQMHQLRSALEKQDLAFGEVMVEVGSESAGQQEQQPGAALEELLGIQRHHFWRNEGEAESVSSAATPWRGVERGRVSLVA